MYVALWFYIATIITVAVLHIVNSLSIPVYAFKSYSVYAGVQGCARAMVVRPQRRRLLSHDAVSRHDVLLRAEGGGGPVYSYRLSIVHFWSLVFIYIWAGPHHLLYTALPDWAQTLGMVFSLMLWTPSWGGMINGLLTLRGAWDKVRERSRAQVLRRRHHLLRHGHFRRADALDQVRHSLAHYTDWIIGHVHSGALGWNGFMAAGMFYWLVPRLWGTKLH